MPLWVADPSPADHYPSGVPVDGLAASNRQTVTATSDAVANTAGPWVEVFAATSVPASGMLVMATSNVFVAAANTATLVDIGIGAAGAEVIWGTLNVGYSQPANFQMFVPGLVAAGVRVAVRCRSVIVSKAVSVTVTLLPSRRPNPAAPVTFGVDTANSRGVLLTSPAAADAKGAWTEIVPSTPAPLSNLLVMIGGGADTVMVNGFTTLDIGVGAAGAETVLVPDVGWSATTSEVYIMRTAATFGVQVPAASRLSARWASNVIGNTVDLVILGA